MYAELLPFSVVWWSCQYLRVWFTTGANQLRCGGGIRMLTAPCPDPQVQSRCTRFTRPTGSRRPS